MFLTVLVALLGIHVVGAGACGSPSDQIVYPCLENSITFEKVGYTFLSAQLLNNSGNVTKDRCSCGVSPITTGQMNVSKIGPADDDRQCGSFIDVIHKGGEQIFSCKQSSYSRFVTNATNLWFRFGKVDLCMRFERVSTVAPNITITCVGQELPSIPSTNQQSTTVAFVSSETTQLSTKGSPQPTETATSSEESTRTPISSETGVMVDSTSNKENKENLFPVGAVVGPVVSLTAVIIILLISLILLYRRHRQGLPEREMPRVQDYAHVRYGHGQPEANYASLQSQFRGSRDNNNSPVTNSHNGAQSNRQNASVDDYTNVNIDPNVEDGTVNYVNMDNEMKHEYQNNMN